MARPNLDIESLVETTAAKYGIPSALLAALIRVESSNNPKAVSKKGAKGLGQLMPATASALGVNDPFDPTQNLEGSARLLSMLMQKYKGNVVLALAAYNAGEPAVDKAKGVPNYPETVKFIEKIAKYVDAPKANAEAGRAPSPVSAPKDSFPRTSGAAETRLPGWDLTAGPPRGQVESPTPQSTESPARGPRAMNNRAEGPSLSKISEKQMNDLLDLIAQEHAQIPLDQSRQFTELQSGGYGSDEGSMPAVSASNQPSLAPFYSGGVMGGPTPQLGWLARTFGLKPTGGKPRLFSDEMLTPSER